MRKANSYLLLIFLLVTALFGFGLFRLIHLRFRTGDLYPKYSSLRADPLGCKALYETLDRMRQVRVERRFRRTGPVASSADVVLFHLGNPPSGGMFGSEGEKLETFVKQGGRLALSFYAPEGWGGASERKAAGKPAEDAPGPEFKLQEPHPMHNRWGAKLGFRLVRDSGIQAGAGGGQARLKARGRPLLRPSIPWHSTLAFDGMTEEWTVLYAVGERPVVMEREYGLGRVVALAESYLFSNESLRERPQSHLVLALLGNRRRVVFDEVHMGILENTGVAGLALKYGLEGLFAGLLLLALLFVWKNAVCLQPPVPSGGSGPPGGSGGRGSQTALVHLLRRSVPPRDLPAVCHAEWRRDRPLSHAAADSEAQALVEQFEATSGRRQSPLGVYRQICESVTRAKGGSSNGQ